MISKIEAGVVIDYPTSLNPPLTPQLVSRAVILVSAGASIRQAVIAAGGSLAALNHWRDMARESISPYCQVMMALDAAAARLTAELAGRVKDAGADADRWKANAWMLEHHPEARSEWGDANTKELGGITIQIGVGLAGFENVSTLDDQPAARPVRLKKDGTPKIVPMWYRVPKDEKEAKAVARAKADQKASVRRARQRRELAAAKAYKAAQRAARQAKKASLATVTPVTTSVT